MSADTNIPIDATQVQAARERYAVSLQRYALHQLGGATEPAKEIVELVWKFFQEQPAAEVAGELGGEWLFLQCRRRIHELTQGGGSGKKVDSGSETEGSAGKNAPEGEEIEAPHVTMQRLIERLTPKQQEAVRLRFEHDFSVQAIARITELTMYNVGVLVHNALAKLARGFRAQHPDESGTAGKGVGIDARLTLYALGEMEDAERTAFEDSLIDKKNAALRVEEIRTIGSLIGQALAIEAGAPAPRTVRKNKRGGAALWWKFPRVLLPAALVLALLVSGIVWLARESDAPARVPRSRVDFTLKPADWKTGEAVPEEAVGRVGGGEGGFGNLSAAGGKRSPVAVRSTHSPRAPGPAREPARAEVTATTDHAPRPIAEPELATDNTDEPNVASQAGSAPMSGGAPAVNRGRHGASSSTVPANPQGKTGEEESAPAPSVPTATRERPASPRASPPGSQSKAKDKGGAKGKSSAATPKSPAAGAEKPFVSPHTAAVSRLAPEVPATSVTRLKQALREGRRPAPGGVKVEELINYFPAGGSEPKGTDLFSATLEATEAPWNPARRLVRVSVRGRAESVPDRGPASLVLLVDVSGSMKAANRLPLVQESVRLLLARLRPDDRVGLVTYAAEPKLALLPTPVEEMSAILGVVEGWQAKGPTNGGAGLELAYELAHDHGVPGGKTCVILCTDGDFNSGPTREEELGRIVDEHKDSGVSLSIYGFGRGRQIDVRLEKLAMRGGGSSGYVNTRREAEQVLAGAVNGILRPLASELNLKVSFTPDQIEGYRLLGYDEHVEGGASGPGPSAASRPFLPGQTFTALYEVIPKPGAPAGGDLLGLQLNYQAADDGTAHEQSYALRDRGIRFNQAGLDFKFAAAVGVFGLVLNNQAPEGMTLEQVEAWALETLGEDAGGYRSEFLAMVREAKAVRPE